MIFKCDGKTLVLIDNLRTKRRELRKNKYKFVVVGNVRVRKYEVVEDNIDTFINVQFIANSHNFHRCESTKNLFKQMGKDYSTKDLLNLLNKNVR